MLIDKVIPAVAAAALGAAATLALPGFSPDADASTPAKVVKSDLDFRPTGPDCSPLAWPYYETHCLRDRSRFAGQARPVRVITTDRIAPQ
jgi:hypothetical protein